MIVLVVPRGRGNWRKVAIVIQTPDLLLQVRGEEVQLEQPWFFAGRWWRVVGVEP